VPGGRYLVAAGNGLSVWDLGYASTADCKLVSSVGLGDYFEFCMVRATPDGKGLVILTCYSNDHLSIFEIFPQSEIPQLTQIAHLDWFPPEEDPVHLLSDTLICRVFYEDRIVFRVVDYRTNFSTTFSVDVDVKKFGFKYNVETFATKTDIIVLCKEGILIWAIPPLSPQPSDDSDLCDYFLDNNSTHIPPLSKILFPDGIARRIHEVEILEFMTVPSWYFGSSESVYFDIIYTDSILQRLKIVIKPDLSDASLHVVNMTEIISDDFIKSLTEGYRVCEGYRICEDALIFFWINRETWGAYTGLTTAPFTNVVSQCDGHVFFLMPGIR